MSETRRSPILVFALPVLLFAVYVWANLGKSTADAAVRPAPSSFGASCRFPGSGPERQRLVVAVIDSLRYETALDREVMPWLAALPEHALSGRMRPCSSQLSLLCFRTMFEGSEPLLVTGFYNFTGMTISADNLLQRLSARGVRVAAVADSAFLTLYAHAIATRSDFEERPASMPSRDEWCRRKTFEWLRDGRYDVIVSHTIDTDATTHRVGVGHPDYRRKFAETDAFLRELAAELGSQDSLIVLGDHGHDARGYHSTGIPSDTAYFARGPLFVAGRRQDLSMASTYLLIGEVGCEAVPASYQGELPLGALVLPTDYRKAQERVAASRPPAPASRAVNAASLELPALLALLLCVGLGGGARWLGGAGALFGYQFSIGLSGHVVLVLLQSHVNPTWTIGFWCGLGLVILGVGRLSYRKLGLSVRHATGLGAALVIFLGLSFGPYYYGSARNLLYGLTWLLVAHADLIWAERASRRWLALCLIPLLPLYAPILKEWQPQYPLLAWVAGLPLAAFGALLGAAFAGALALSPDRRRLLGALPLYAAFCGLGFATELGRVELATSALLFLSYVGFCEVAERAARAARSASAAWVLPIGQACYAFFAFFLLLGALRFAGVDFRFALELTPAAEGELRAALWAVPIMLVKYLGAVLLLLAAGPPLSRETLLLVLLKIGCLGAGLLGFDLLARREVTLFAELQSQESALVALLYVALFASFALRRPLPRPGAA